MSVKRLLPNQRIADANGLPSREFVEIVQRIVGRLPEIVAEAESYADGIALGAGQAWETFTIGSERQGNTSYQNTTGRPIAVSIDANPGANGVTVQVSSDNSTWIDLARFATNAGRNGIFAIIPAGHYYRTNGTLVSLNIWAELR